MIPIALGMAAASSLYDALRTPASTNTPFSPATDPAAKTDGQAAAKSTGLDHASAKRVSHHKAALLSLQADPTTLPS